MGEGFQFLDIIFFAMVAAFLVLRLRSVLGRRTGQERRPPPDPFARRAPEARPEDKVVEFPERRDAPARETPAPEPPPSDTVVAGLTQIKIADPGFDRDQFLTGARRAFETVVQAFAQGDQAALRALLSDEVMENFTSVIRQRESAGHVLETTVIGIKNAQITGARIEDRNALVTVQFVSEQVNITRDRDGKIVEGDPSQVAAITDEWTFGRNPRSHDPNWLLVETESQT